MKVSDEEGHNNALHTGQINMIKGEKITLLAKSSQFLGQFFRFLEIGEKLPELPKFRKLHFGRKSKPEKKDSLKNLVKPPHHYIHPKNDENSRKNGKKVNWLMCYRKINVNIAN